MITSVLLVACALKNPEPPRAPAAWQPPPAAPAEPAPAAAATAAAASGAAADPAAQSGTPAGNPGGNPTGNPAGAPAGSAPTEDPVVAVVAGRPIHTSELLAHWLYTGRAEARDVLDQIVLGRLVVAEATRLGVRIAPELAEDAYERSVETLEKEIRSSRKAFESITLDRYVDEVLGLDPLRYRERLRDDGLRTLLGQRVVRAWLLQNHNAFVRVIVVRTEEDKKAVETDLAAGQPFADVAKARSKDPSAKDGGLIPPLVRANSPIASLAFATEPGKVGGPIAEQSNFLFVYVEKRGAPLEGDWTVLGPAVEESLRGQEVEQLELEQWRRGMRERYTVDLGPFRRLAGEVAR